MNAKFYPLWAGAFVLSATFLSAQGIPDCGGPPSDVPPAETCAETCVYCDFHSMTGNTGAYQGNTPPPGFCGSVQNDQWVAFLANKPEYSITITPSNCVQGNGVELALYEFCNAVPLSCAPGQAGGGTAPRTVQASNLIPGRNYYLMIDGYNGDVCDFSLVDNEPPHTDPGPLTIGQIQGPAKTCPGSTKTYYEVPVVSGAGYYTWSSSVPGILFDGQPSLTTFLAPGGRRVQVTPPPNFMGNIQLCVNAWNSCNPTGVLTCRTINVQPIPNTILPTIKVCYEDREPWMQLGNLIYRDTFISHLGCDSVVEKRLIVKPSLITNIGTKYICEGSHLLVCGDTLRETGQIQSTCTSYEGCDSMVKGYLYVLQPKFTVTSPGKNTLNCIRKEVPITLAGLPNNAIVIWRKLPQGTVIGTGKSIIIKTPGLYTATSSVTLGGISCIYRQQFEIKQILTEPEPLKIRKEGSLGAGDPSVQLLASSLTNVLYQWIGPQGFTAVIPDPVVTVPGLYKVTATHVFSGCSTSASILVD